MTKETTKTRQSKTGAKGRKNATRTAEGAAFTPEKYDPGNTQVSDDVTGFNRFNLQEIDFLDNYAEHKADLKAIKAATGLNTDQVDRLLAKDSIRAEVIEIQNVWRLNRKMTAEHAAAKHIRLMAEMERDYNAIDCPVDRSKMANPRVKASETYLRAVGHFNHGNETQDSQVIINIDLGGDASNEKKIIIEGEKSE